MIICSAVANRFWWSFHWKLFHELIWYLICAHRVRQVTHKISTIKLKSGGDSSEQKIAARFLRQSVCSAICFQTSVQNVRKFSLFLAVKKKHPNRRRSLNAAGMLFEYQSGAIQTPTRKQFRAACQINKITDETAEERMLHRML